MCLVLILKSDTLSFLAATSRQVTTTEFFDQLKVHLSDHLQLDISIVHELTDETAQRCVTEIFDENEDGSISLLEMCTSLNSIKSITNEKTNCIASAIRMIKKMGSKDNNHKCRFHVPALSKKTQNTALGRDSEVRSTA